MFSSWMHELKMMDITGQVISSAQLMEQANKNQMKIDKKLQHTIVLLFFQKRELTTCRDCQFPRRPPSCMVQKAIPANDGLFRNAAEVSSQPRQRKRIFNSYLIFWLVTDDLNVTDSVF